MGLDFVYNQPSTRVTSRNAEQLKDLKKLRNDGNKEVKKGVLVSCLRPATLLKKVIWHRCFPVNFAKFQRIPLLQNTSGQLPLTTLTISHNFFFFFNFYFYFFSFFFSFFSFCCSTSLDCLLYLCPSSNVFSFF